MADIELVIKIPEEKYLFAKNLVNGGKENNPVVLAVGNGTPLPKGHGDLIDVNRKITVSTYDEQYEEWGEQTLTVLDALNKWSDEGVRVEDVVIPGIAPPDEEEEELGH